MAVLFKHRLGERYPAADPTKPEPCRTRDLFHDKIEECSFCGEPRATGYWRGVGNPVSLCRACAVDTLPKLVADALLGECPERERVILELQHKLTAFHETFWRAAAVALDRHVQHQRTLAE